MVSKLFHFGQIWNIYIFLNFNNNAPKFQQPPKNAFSALTKFYSVWKHWPESWLNIQSWKYTSVWYATSMGKLF